MAQHRCRLRMLVEMTQDFADIRILHQIDHRWMAAGDKHTDVAVKAFLDDGAQGARCHHPRILFDEIERSPQGCFVPIEMRGVGGSLVHHRFGALRGGQDEIIACLNCGHNRNAELVQVEASRNDLTGL